MAEIDTDFALTINYKKAEGDPTRIFRTMTGLIETFQMVDMMLLTSMDSRIQPLIMLDEVEADSLKAKLRTLIRFFPDDAILHLDPKPILGQFLLMAKKKIIDFTTDQDSITNIESLTPLIDELSALSDKTHLKMLPAYKPVKPRELLDNMVGISASLEHLNKEDSVMYSSSVGEAKFNPAFKLTPEMVEDLVTEKSLLSESEMILKIKKPDLLGDSMWEFKHGPAPMSATIEDKQWLKAYRARMVQILPQDSIQAVVKTTRKYDSDNELIGEHYSLIKVIGIISGPEQSNMFPK